MSDENQTTNTQSPAPKIHSAIIAVMAEIGAIEKTRKNQQQNFMFRGVGDAMAACQPLFVKHKLYIRPLKVSADHTKDNIDKEGRARGLHSRQTIIYRATSAEDGSYVDSEATGEAIDFADKCAGKVMSVSFKFLIFQMFCIPDYSPDSDPDGHSPGIDGGSGGGNGQAPRAQQQKPAQQPAQGKPATPAPDAAAEKKQALEDLVALLKSKGIVGGKKVLPWLSDYTNPRRKLAKLSEITEGEFAAMSKAANELPALGTGPTE